MRIAMRTGIVVVAMVLAVGACKKNKEAAPASATEKNQTPAQPTPAETGAPSTGGVGNAGSGSAAQKQGTMPSDDGGEANGSDAERMKRMPSDDGGETKTRATMPSDDGGEAKATRKSCTKTSECPAKHDCCDGQCYKANTAEWSLKCQLPAGKL